MSKVTVYSFCWNEKVILPHFLKHYDWADKIIIYDNYSDDGSQEIIKSHPKTELRLFDTGGYQHERLTQKIKNNCWRGDDADWVVVCDMDEFLIGYEKLEEYKGKICAFDCTVFQVVTEEIPIDFSTVKSIYQIIRIRRRRRTRGMLRERKTICFSPKLQHIHFGLGAHVSHPIPDNKVLDAMKCYHYAALSEDYFVNRLKSRANRILPFDLAKGRHAEYLWSEEKIREEFRRRLALTEKHEELINIH